MLDKVLFPFAVMLVIMCALVLLIGDFILALYDFSTGRLKKKRD